MHTQRTHVILPQLLLAEIDELVGPRRQSAFLVETARAELKRRRLLEFLSSDGLHGATKIILSWSVGLQPGCAKHAHRRRRATVRV
jgi:hypothetical protein